MSLWSDLVTVAAELPEANLIEQFDWDRYAAIERQRFWTKTIQEQRAGNPVPVRLEFIDNTPAGELPATPKTETEGN